MNGTAANTNADNWLTLPECMQVARVHHATLRREMKAGKLRFTRVGGRKLIRIRRSWLDAWLSGDEASRR